MAQARRRFDDRESSHSVTLKLQAAAEGDEAARDALAELVLPTLQRIAAGKLNGMARSHTLEPCALANEAWMRLDKSGGQWPSRAHYFSAASTTIKRLLIDYSERVRPRGRDRSKDRKSVV